MHYQKRTIAHDKSIITEFDREALNTAVIKDGIFIRINQLGILVSFVIY